MGETEKTGEEEAKEEEEVKKDDDSFFTHEIPVVFHNLKGYDSHLIISRLNEEVLRGCYTNVIPLNTEKYLTFSISNLKFIDSLNFLSSSLENLVNNLNACHKCNNTLIIDEKKMENNKTPRCDLTDCRKNTYKKMGFHWCNDCKEWVKQDIDKLEKVFKHTFEGTAKLRSEG